MMLDGYRWRPLYSADNEDTRSELTALEITGDDTVVAIAAGGGRALSLLTAGPKRLVAIDKRVDQIFCLELKAAALDTFEYENFLRFLGIAESQERLDQYQTLRPSLSRSARRYWDRRRALVKSGCFYAGRTETALIRFMKGLKALGLMEWAKALFEAPNFEAQAALLETHRQRVERDLAWWRVFCHPLVIYPLAQDPSFLRSTETSVGVYFVRRMLDYAAQNLVRDSYALRFAYDCGCSPSSPLPPYLTKVGFDQARKHAERLELQSGEIRDFVSRSRASGSVKWSLSDVSCWMTEADFHDLLRSVAKIGIPGSRFCARNFAARREFPRDLLGKARRLDQLCNHLDSHDSSVIYRFEVGEVRERA